MIRHLGLLAAMLLETLLLSGGKTAIFWIMVADRGELDADHEQARVHPDFFNDWRSFIGMTSK